MAKELIINKIKGLSESRKIGRNETCPCGSGKKFKKCHAK
jgi:preprotein translocase subunit SecA